MYNMYEWIRSYMVEHDVSYKEAYEAWRDAVAEAQYAEWKEHRYD